MRNRIKIHNMNNIDNHISHASMVLACERRTYSKVGVSVFVYHRARDLSRKKLSRSDIFRHKFRARMFLSINKRKVRLYARVQHMFVRSNVRLFTPTR